MEVVVRGPAGVALPAIAVVLGTVWLAQGAGLLGGSFMTGEPAWVAIGAAPVCLGVTALLLRRSRR